MIGEFFPEAQQCPVPEPDPVAGTQRLAADFLSIDSAGRLAAQVGVDVLVSLIAADLGVPGGQPLQAQISLDPLPMELMTLGRVGGLVWSRLR